MATPRKTATKTTPKEAPKPRVSTQKYIRNLRNMPISLRLERHEGKPRFEMRPRGQRGDTISIQKDDISDPIFQQNHALGLFEVLTATEAADVMVKQATNAQQAIHPSLAMLTNSKGEVMDVQEAQMAATFESQGEVVGNIDSKGNYERRGDSNLAPGVPEGVVGAAPGHAPTNEDPAFLSDVRARRKDLEGPGSIITQVTVEPPQKS